MNIHLRQVYLLKQIHQGGILYYVNNCLYIVVVQCSTITNAHTPPLLTNCCHGYYACGFGYIFTVLDNYHIKLKFILRYPWLYLNNTHKDE